MRVVEIAKTEAPNPFAADIAELIKQTETNPLAAGIFEVPVAEAGVGGSKTKYKIGKAANAVDRTAAILSEEVIKGIYTVTVRIKPRHQSKPRGPRKPKNEVATTK
jgi:hypothetical protein